MVISHGDKTRIRDLNTGELVVAVVEIAVGIPGTPYFIKDWKSCWIESSNPKNQVQRSKIGMLSPEFPPEFPNCLFALLRRRKD
jgi:hypothetical protein